MIDSWKFRGIILAAVCLTILCPFNIFGINNVEVDSLKNELKSELSDHARFQVYKKIFTAYYYTQPDSAEYFARELINVGEDKKSVELEVKGLHLLARVLNRKKEKIQALELSKKAMSKSRLAGRDDLISLSLSYMGRWHTSLKQYDSAAYYFKQRIQLAEIRQLEPNKMIPILTCAIYPLRITGRVDEAFALLVKAEKYLQEDEENITEANKVLIYNKFRNFYSLTDDLSKAIEYSKKALILKKKKGDTRDAGSEAYLLGVFYKASGNNETAVEYLTYASKFYTHIDDREVGFRLFSRLGYSLKYLGQCEKALEAFKTKLRIANNLDTDKFIADAYCSLGEVYLEMGQPNSAKQSLNQAVLLFNKTLNDEKQTIEDNEMFMIYASLASADSTLGNYKSAMEHYGKALEFKQKVNDLKLKKKVKELEIRYETEKKNNQIALLNEKNSIATISAEKQSQFKWMLAAVSTLLIIIVSVLYNRNRLKKKSMKIIEQKGEENARLVQEIHHRVKNNLQIMLSMLGTQSHLITDEEARKLICESQNRIKSMALIHKNLYQSGSLVMVQTDSYFDEIAANILSSFEDTSRQVTLKTNIHKQEISMAVAVPLGLILNELLTNSIKYAFNDIDDAELTVSFEKTEQDTTYHLRVKDNGRGLPDDFCISNSNSFGLKLVEGLTQQLNGSLQIAREVGTCFDIYFKDRSVA